jgi:hypothetical protein
MNIAGVKVDPANVGFGSLHKVTIAFPQKYYSLVCQSLDEVAVRGRRVFNGARKVYEFKKRSDPSVKLYLTHNKDYFKWQNIHFDSSKAGRFVADILQKVFGADLDMECKISEVEIRMDVYPKNKQRIQDVLHELTTGLVLRGSKRHQEGKEKTTTYLGTRKSTYQGRVYLRPYKKDEGRVSELKNVKKALRLKGPTHVRMEAILRRRFIRDRKWNVSDLNLIAENTDLFKLFAYRESSIKADCSENALKLLNSRYRRIPANLKELNSVVAEKLLENGDPWDGGTVIQQMLWVKEITGYYKVRFRTERLFPYSGKAERLRKELASGKITLGSDGAKSLRGKKAMIRREPPRSQVEAINRHKMVRRNAPGSKRRSGTGSKMVRRRPPKVKARSEAPPPGETTAP